MNATDYDVRAATMALICADQLARRITNDEADARRAQLAELDHLTAGLVEASDEVARRLDNLLRPKAAVCSWCGEPGCDGSASRCEGYDDRIDLEHQALQAPELRTTYRTGGAR